MNQAALLNRFKTESVATASPAKLLTMLYDRLVLDLDRGIAALEADDRADANTQLTHAQDIIHELRSSLDLNAWDGARGLMDLYGYLLSELVGANIARSSKRVTACRDLLIPLRDAWHEAANATTATGGSVASARAAAAVASAPTGYQPMGDLGVA
ncbi:flagellar export chaperone FliS [Georgenia sp. SYP-B2076]|uniref:flagellar export chaperone FliS n=1 Tax=Georgenia sp. SYP-B2076 TaxID=2495881 RepID=UPI000F8F3CEE|nr:flagellar export chaperone FliS [Georgenia sp. SYP-B2076]